MARGAALVALARVSRRLARKLLAGPERDTFDALSSADLVLLEGGSYLRAEGRATHVVHVWRVLFPVLLGLALGKRVIGLGHSIGPIAPGLAGRLLRWGLRRDWDVLVRDAESRCALEAITGRPARVVPDCAIGLASGAPPRRERPMFRLGLNLRPVPDAEQVARALVQVVAKIEPRPSEILVIANGFGPSPKQDDRPVNELLARLLRGAGLDCDVLVPPDPEAAMAVYADCSVVVSIRMHAGILARVSGTPSVVLEYEGHKASGVFSYLAPGVSVPGVGEQFEAPVLDLIARYRRDSLPPAEADAVGVSAANFHAAVAEVIGGRA